MDPANNRPLVTFWAFGKINEIVDEYTENGQWQKRHKWSLIFLHYVYQDWAKSTDYWRASSIQCSTKYKYTLQTSTLQTSGFLTGLKIDLNSMLIIIVIHCQELGLARYFRTFEKCSVGWFVNAELLCKPVLIHIYPAAEIVSYS